MIKPSQVTHLQLYLYVCFLTSKLNSNTLFQTGAAGGTLTGRNLDSCTVQYCVQHDLKIPASVADKASPAYNRGHIGAYGASPAVAEAFAEVSQKGLRRFFECRAEEMAPGGVLAFLCAGRRDRARPEVQYPDDTMVYTPHLEKALVELVSEGVISEELLDSFNLTGFCPSVDDIREAVEHPTSEFHIHNLEYIPDFSPFPENAGETMFKDASSFATIVTNLIKGSLGSTITAHLGAELADALFQRLGQNFEKQYQQWKDVRFFKPVPLCLAVLLRK